MQFILCASKSAMSVHHAEGEESAKKLLCNMVLKDSSLEGPGGGGQLVFENANDIAGGHQYRAPVKPLAKATKLKFVERREGQQDHDLFAGFRQRNQYA